jgi:hypothetical protein
MIIIIWQQWGGSRGAVVEMGGRKESWEISSRFPREWHQANEAEARLLRKNLDSKQGVGAAY